MSEVLAQLKKKGGGGSIFLIGDVTLSNRPAATVTKDSDSQTTVASNTVFGSDNLGGGYPMNTTFNIAEFVLGRNATVNFSATEGGSLLYCAYIITVNDAEVFRTAYQNQVQTFSRSYPIKTKIKIQIYNRNLSNGRNKMEMVING
jgi:hypothetical protein